jgi:hypothetical protein
MESKVNIGNKDFLGIFGETRFNGPEWVPVGKNYRGTYSFGVEWMKTKIYQK